MSLAPPAPLNSYGFVEPESDLLGREYYFEDLNLGGTTGSNAAPKLTGIKIVAIPVVNNTGGVLLSGHVCKFDTGSTYGPWRGVNAKAGDDEHGDGVVAPYLPSAGVPDGKVFWLVRQGPCLLQYDGSATIAISDHLMTAAAGRTREFVEGTDDEDSRFGRALAAKTSGSAGDTFRALVYFTV